MQTPNDDQVTEQHRGLAIACIIAQADLDIALQCNRLERMGIVTDAVVLMLIWTWAFMAWSLFVATFAPLGDALVVAFLIAGFILSIDRNIASSDWSPKGILRTERHSGEGWRLMWFRVAISLVLSVATATGITLKMFSHAIAAELQTERTQTNQPLQADYQARKDALKAQMIQPLQADLDSLQAERETLRKNLQSATEERREQLKDASHQRIEMERELHGAPGYVAGYGPRAKDRARLLHAAEEQSQNAASEFKANQARLHEIDGLIDSKVKALRDAQQVFETKSHALDAAMTSDARWMPKRNDPLLQMLALDNLRSKPAYRSTIWQTEIMAAAVLNILELAIILQKSVFPPATNYTTRLRERAKFEDECVREEYDRKRSQMTPAAPAIDIGVDADVTARPDARIIYPDDVAKRNRQSFGDEPPAAGGMGA